MSEIILINITGKDQKGLVARMNGILAEYSVNILDIGQAVIHEYISLGVLAEIPDESLSSTILKELLFAGHDLDVNVNYAPVEPDRYEKWVTEQGKERRIITLLGRNLSAQQISAVAGVIAENGMNIDVITRLSGRVSLQDPAVNPKACVQFTATGALSDPQAMRGQLLQISHETGTDISFHLDDVYRRNRRLVVFDMDSTLIQTEVINDLATAAGVGDEVAAITEAAMRGELDFQASLRRRVALLEGLDETVLAEIADHLPLTEGAERVVGTLKRLGYKIGILSGGFDYFGHRLQAMLDIDYVYANQLEIIDGKLTGRLRGPIVDGPMKAELLKQIASAEELKLAQTIAVGDGANDLDMLAAAGLGVAFHAKPIVREQAEQAISSVGLDGLLYLIGVRDREVAPPVTVRG